MNGFSIIFVNIAKLHILMYVYYLTQNGDEYRSVCEYAGGNLTNYINSDYDPAYWLFKKKRPPLNKDIMYSMLSQQKVGYIQVILLNQL